jgi:hypothetical protein
MRAQIGAFLNEPDAEEFPPPRGMAADWLDSGLRSCLGSEPEPSNDMARLAVLSAIKNLSVQDALEVLEQSIKDLSVQNAVEVLEQWALAMTAGNILSLLFLLSLLILPILLLLFVARHI